MSEMAMLHKLPNARPVWQKKPLPDFLPGASSYSLFLHGSGYDEARICANEFDVFAILHDYQATMENPTSGDIQGHGSCAGRTVDRIAARGSGERTDLTAEIGLSLGRQIPMTIKS